MLPRLLALLCLSSLLAACSGAPPAPPLDAPKPAAVVATPEPLPAQLRELSGQLLGVPTAGEAELALLLVDARDRPVQLLASSRLNGTGAALPFSLRFRPISIPPGSRLELRGRVSQAGVLTLRLPPRPINPNTSATLGELRLVTAP